MRLIAQNPLVLHFTVKWGERERESETEIELQDFDLLNINSYC